MMIVFLELSIIIFFLLKGGMTYAKLGKSVVQLMGHICGHCVLLRPPDTKIAFLRPSGALHRLLEPEFL